jgi:Fe2+ transport system protein FeoA
MQVYRKRVFKMGFIARKTLTMIRMEEKGNQHPVVLASFQPSFSF